MEGKPAPRGVAERRSAAAATTRARSGRARPPLRPRSRAFCASPRLARPPRPFAAPHPERSPSDGADKGERVREKDFCRTFVLTPLQHLLDDAQAQRVIVDDEDPEADGEARVCDFDGHLARPRSARQTLSSAISRLGFSRVELEKIRGCEARIVAAGRNVRLVGRDVHLTRDACGNANDPRDDAREWSACVCEVASERARLEGKHTRVSFPGSGSVFEEYHNWIAGWHIQFFDTDAPYGQMDTVRPKSIFSICDILETQTVAFRFTFWETGRLRVCEVRCSVFSVRCARYDSSLPYKNRASRGRHTRSRPLPARRTRSNRPSSPHVARHGTSTGPRASSAAQHAGDTARRRV